ncbi:hypothetical protein ACXU4B_17735 [Dyella soli]|nr:hypothetical protein [Dyella soli]
MLFHLLANGAAIAIVLAIARSTATDGTFSTRRKPKDQVARRPS